MIENEKLEIFKRCSEIYVDFYSQHNDKLEKMYAHSNWAYEHYELGDNDLYFNYIDTESHSLASLRKRTKALKKALDEHVEVINEITTDSSMENTFKEFDGINVFTNQLKEFDVWCETRSLKLKPSRTGRRVETKGRMLLHGLEQLHQLVYEKPGSLYVGGHYLDIVTESLSAIGVECSVYTTKRKLEKIRDGESFLLKWGDEYRFFLTMCMPIFVDAIPKVFATFLGTDAKRDDSESNRELGEQTYEEFDQLMVRLKALSQ
jgi:hypothetical protein